MRGFSESRRFGQDQIETFSKIASSRILEATVNGSHTGEDRSRGTVSRILSARLAGRRESFISAAYTRVSGPFGPWSGPLRASYLALHPAGFSVPRRSRAGRWSLTPPFHPYRTVASPAVYSLWHFPSARLEACCPRVSRRLRGAASCGVRTFLFHFPSRVLEAILRPSEPADNISQHLASTTLEHQALLADFPGWAYHAATLPVWYPDLCKNAVKWCPGPDSNRKPID